MRGFEEKTGLDVNERLRWNRAFSSSTGVVADAANLARTHKAKEEFGNNNKKIETVQLVTQALAGMGVGASDPSNPYRTTRLLPVNRQNLTQHQIQNLAGDIKDRLRNNANGTSSNRVPTPVGESYLQQSPQAINGTTVQLTQAQRLSDGRIIPQGSVVSVSDNALKATTPSGEVIRANSKLLQQQGLTHQPREFVLTEDRATKLFGKREGHILDTPENRKMFLEIANDPNSIRGYDIHKHGWHEKILPNGKQVWVQTRNEKIWNAGINDTPRSYNPGTGFAAPINQPKNKRISNGKFND